MKMFLLTAFILFVNMLCISALAQADWEIEGDGESLQSSKPYYLKVKSNGKFLKYQSRDDKGINLGWGKTDKPYIKFIKAGGGEIKNGDKIAIFMGDQTGSKKYLKYEVRTHGINLSWSAVPVYEWELRDLENKIGNTIKTNTTIGIVNWVERKNQGDFIMYCERKLSPTVNLAWFGDCADGKRYPGKLNNIKKELDFAIEHKEKLLLLL